MANPEWDNYNPENGKLSEKQLAKFKEDILKRYGDDMLPIDEIMCFLKDYRFSEITTIHEKHMQEKVEVRRAVAANPKTHSDILHQMADDPDFIVRKNIALNPNAHDETISKLALDI